MDLRTGIVLAVLVAAPGLWGWWQKSMLESEKQTSADLSNQLDTAQGEARANLATANELKSTLERERDGQTKLLQLQGELRAGLAKRERQIEDLKNENQELRNWADQPLPDAARRLRQRPTITGADAYREWLSGSGALRAGSDGPDEKRTTAQ
ncbi:LysB family transcriptional regulator [Pseudomonas putida]|nr:LysB family transcriptional regulator [Pseudomonas putida]